MLQVFLNIFHFGMDVQDAIDAPRVTSLNFPSSFSPYNYYPGFVSLEGRIPETVQQELEGRGHRLDIGPDYTRNAAAVEVIVAEGFERIHRTNLVGMGVLPLEFKAGESRHTYAIDGTETFDVVGQCTPGCTMTVVINRTNGESLEVAVTCRL